MTATLYRTYDQAELDRQLNLRARWPEHLDYFARWARDSAAVRSRLTCHLNLAYGPTVGQRLDLFPARSDGSPLLVFIHGGYWQSLDKSDFSYLAPGFVSAGTTFASVNYDLAPPTRISDMVGQVRRALVWLHNQAASRGFDPDRIFVAGHSAGGHLAAMLMATDWSEVADVPSNLIKGVCSVSGIYDLEPISLCYQQPVLSISPEEVMECSPLRCRPKFPSPAICAVGGEETEEFQHQQEDLLRAWSEAGLTTAAVDLPGRNHFTAIDALGEADHPLFSTLCNLISGKGPGGDAMR